MTGPSANLCLDGKVCEALATLNDHDVVDEIRLVCQSFEIVDEPAGFYDGWHQRLDPATSEGS